jgi:hypothetical protein
MKKTAKWRQSLLKSIQLQLFISFISLPFLIGWGLPISILTPFSTLIFGPFLTGFLLLSSVIFFLELFYLPNYLFIWLLELLTSIWLFFLNLEQRAWLIAFTKPPIFILVCIPLLALAVIHSKKLTTINARIYGLTALLICNCIALKLFPYNYKTIDTIACNKGAITLINHNNTLTMIDPGFMASRPSFESWISYTLTSAIAEKTGRMSIDHVIVFKLNKRVFDALSLLATKVKIHTIYMPAWKGKIPSFAWYSYIKLKKTVALYNGKIIPISKQRSIFKTEDSMLFLEPATTKDICYYDATYPSLSVGGSIGNDTISIRR